MTSASKYNQSLAASVTVPFAVVAILYHRLGVPAGSFPGHDGRRGGHFSVNRTSASSGPGKQSPALGRRSAPL